MALGILGALGSPAIGRGLGIGLGIGLGLALGGAASGRGGESFAGSGELGGLGDLPLGGLGAGMGNPMFGMGQLGQMDPQIAAGIGQLLGMLMEAMGEQGMQGPCLGGCADGGCGSGFPGMDGGCDGGGFPGLGGGCGGGFPGLGGAFPGMGGPQGMLGMNPMGMQGGPGQTIELQKGDSFTTPGGSTINWAGGAEEEVKISEPGNAQQGQRNFGGGNGVNMAASFAGPGFSAALSMSAGGTPGPLGCAAGMAGQDAEPRDWRVWGDPHIDHPNGEKSDFQTKNSMFTLQDGTRVMMGADNPKGIVNRVQIVLPGGQPNWDGMDPSQTTVMQDNGRGKFESAGTADQFMQGGFGGPPGLSGIGGLMGLLARR
jgi:hypothetical protein